MLVGQYCTGLVYALFHRPSPPPPQRLRSIGRRHTIEAQKGGELERCATAALANCSREGCTSFSPRRSRRLQQLHHHLGGSENGIAPSSSPESRGDAIQFERLLQKSREIPDTDEQQDIGANLFLTYELKEET
jgi:hypothetical protein